MTLNIQISKKDFEKYGFKSAKLDWKELIEKIKTELAKEALLKSKTIAENTGLSRLSLNEINAEIKAVRDAKSRS